MAPSKSVSVGVGVSAAVALVTLLVVLIVVFTPKKTPAPPQPDCGDPPVVNDKTGEVVNYTNSPLPDGTCGEDVAALNTMCRNTWCNSSQPECNSTTRTTWDTYNKDLHRCVKVDAPTCEQQMCDAIYCTSASVQETLPPIHKLQTSSGACVNPSQVEVAAMCNALPDHQFVFPDCRAVGMRPVINFTLAVTTTVAIAGQLSIDADGVTGNWLFSYKLEGLTGVTHGVLTTSLPIDTTQCAPTGVCLSFSILLPLDTVRPGAYTLTLFARPPWSSVNTLVSTQPTPLTLVEDQSSDPNVKAALNVKLDREAALRVMQDAPTLRKLLTTLVPQLPGMCVSPSLTLDNLLTVSLDPNNSVSSKVLALACTPNVCPLQGAGVRLMPYVIVCVAWPLVQPVTSCSGTVKYAVTKDGFGAVTNPSVAVLPEYAAFVDLIRVGEVVSYSIKAQQGSCTSQPSSVTVYVPTFDDKTVCHQVYVDQRLCEPRLTQPSATTALPPWMWSSTTGCVWYPDLQAAQDYYCLFEHDNTDHTVNTKKFKLASGSNTCEQVLPSYPALTTSWTSPFCNDSTRAQEVCFDGYEDPTKRTAMCSASLPLGETGDSISNSGSLIERLNGAVNFYQLHNVWDTASVNDIASGTKQQEVYNELHHCDLITAPDQWGIDGTKCAAGDDACIEAAKNGKCGLLPDDRNQCSPWEKQSTTGNITTFAQSRRCWGDADFTSKNCCPADKTYSFNRASKPRGWCASA